MSVPHAITAVVLGVGMALGMFVYFLVNQNTPTAHEPQQNRRYVPQPEPSVQRRSNHSEPPTSNKQKKKEREERPADRNCIICFDEIDQYSRTTLGCYHSFHTDCISTWRKESNKCPVCRNEILVT